MEFEAQKMNYSTTLIQTDFRKLTDAQVIEAIMSGQAMHCLTQQQKELELQRVKAQSDRYCQHLKNWKPPSSRLKPFDPWVAPKGYRIVAYEDMPTEKAKAKRRSIIKAASNRTKKIEQARERRIARRKMLKAADKRTLAEKVCDVHFNSNGRSPY